MLSKRRVAALVSLSIIFTLMLASCGPAAATPAATGENAPPGEAEQNSPEPGTAGVPSGESYPGPEDAGVSPTESYPAPPQPNPEENFYPESIAVPQPAQGAGVVTGKLVNDGEVYLAPILILGGLVYASDPQYPPLVEYSVETSPKAIQDQTGKFVFQDVPPGEYAMVIWTPEAQTLVTDSSGEYVAVTVEADKVTDLGELLVP
jgi:hypothetical protein